MVPPLIQSKKNLSGRVTWHGKKSNNSIEFLPDDKAKNEIERNNHSFMYTKYIIIYREGERERGREGERERERERERQRERDTERERQRETESERDGEKKKGVGTKECVNKH